MASDSKRQFSIRTPLTIGILSVLIFFGGAGYWAMSARLQGAAVAVGSIAASGQNKLVQHLEGGIVTSINVSEGDLVKAGQPILTLDPTRAESELERLRDRKDTLLATQARLRAMRSGLDEIAFPDELLARSDEPGVKAALSDEREEFAAQAEHLKTEQSIIRQRIGALNEQITGLEAQANAAKIQLAFAEDERSNVESLLKQGLATQQRFMELNRAAAAFSGELGSQIATIARARQNIAEAKLEISKARTAQTEDAAAKLTQVRSELADLQSRISAAADILGRTVIRSPIDGVVNTLTVHTIGGIVRPGAVVVELLPANADLIVQALVHPQDIDLVHVGQTATVRLSALNQRTTPTLSADVIYVSADRIKDERSEQQVYVARLRFQNLDSVRDVKAELYPGMQVEVYLQTGERTFLEYIIKPILDSMQRSFREP